MSGEAIVPLVFRHPVSAASHLLYALWAMAATALFWRLTRHDRARRRGSLTFGLCLVLLYLASGLYHAVGLDRPALLEAFRRLDLAAIHLLIAGTCTPILALLHPGRFRAALLVLIWLPGLAGALAKTLLPLPPYPVALGLYATQGLAGLLPVLALRRQRGGRGLAWLFGGALVYAVGGLCEALRWPIPWPGVLGPHEILHGCDMAGSTAHVVFVLRHVIPPSPPCR